MSFHLNSVCVLILYMLSDVYCLAPAVYVPLVQMATGKAQHYNAHKRYLLTLELKHESCMSVAELAEADRGDEDLQITRGGAESATEESSSDTNSDSGNDTDSDSDEDELSTTDGEHLHSDGDEMDEESLVIAREMADDQRDFHDQDVDPDSLGGGDLLHIPDESELIEGGTVVALIAIPAPWEPWDQESEEKGIDRENRDRGARELDDMEIDIDPHDGLSALRPPMMRSEGSRIMHGNATTHEDCG